MFLVSFIGVDSIRLWEYVMVSDMLVVGLCNIMNIVLVFGCIVIWVNCFFI